MGTDTVFEVPDGQEGVGAHRLAMEVVMVTVGHVDATVVGVECPMSNFLYFLLHCDFLLLLLPDLFSLTGVKGLESLFIVFLSFLVHNQLFSSWGKKRALPACPRGCMILSGLFHPSCRYRCHPLYGWSSPHQPCLQGWHNESSQSHSVPWGENPFWKSIYIVLYSFLSVGSQCKPSKSL